MNPRSVTPSARSYDDQADPRIARDSRVMAQRVADLEARLTRLEGRTTTLDDEQTSGPTPKVPLILERPTGRLALDVGDALETTPLGKLRVVPCPDPGTCPNTSLANIANWCNTSLVANSLRAGKLVT